MISKKKTFDELREKTATVLDLPINTWDKMQQVCQLLKDTVPYYDWVGFYLGDEATRQLQLGPFVGEATEHTLIPFGRGICGQAAERRETFVVQDVARESNYLSCNIHVKAEIVIPIFKNDRIIGELDIDSHTIAPFTDEDRVFLEQLCMRFGPLL